MEIKLPTTGSIVLFTPGPSDQLAACEVVERVPAIVLQVLNGLTVSLSVFTMNVDEPVIPKFSVRHVSEVLRVKGEEAQRQPRRGGERKH